MIVGPWIAEVGFEVLYWIPFLRRFVADHGLDPERLTVVSRGGTGCWYKGLCGRYVELFDVVDPAEFRRHSEALWLDLRERKQQTITQWDERLLDSALGREWRSEPLLHPSLMRAVFRPWWRAEVPVEYAVRHTRTIRLAPPNDDAIEAALPERFAAVRLYHRPSFPREHRRFAIDVLRRLADRIPVVLLDPSLAVDDHADLDLDGMEDGSVLPVGGFAASRNLHLQSVVISRADLFVGTYGGLSYLAPLYGVPSLGLATLPHHTNPAHLELAERTVASGGGSILVLDPFGVEAIDSVWPGTETA